ncbi:hypothetical protein PHLCEN_2v2383 [Hermanssonia centrifuga]|uniref:Uncharacterized protein n=1 Tax=Hermanssonia centrifuga TaxID=98765 RepID=A0A2R6RLZ3_9APHY|nr:hypothetical protein PHLCEN_2v2383 [Hermanssonia centrifuga]
MRASPSRKVGPLEVLRVAMMQGGLDDLRNDVARALRRNDIDPDVLASLLQGLQGIGIDFTNARQGLIDFQLKASGCPARSCVSYKLKLEGRCGTRGNGGKEAVEEDSGGLARRRRNYPHVGEPSTISVCDSRQFSTETGDPCKNCAVQHDESAGACFRNMMMVEKENVNDSPQKDATTARKKTGVKRPRRKPTGGKKWAIR